MREYQVRFREGLGVKFPGPTRRKADIGISGRQYGIWHLADVLGARFVPLTWRTELMNQLSTHVILDPMGVLNSTTDKKISASEGSGSFSRS